MSDFKMVENRKYNDEEIKYVISRTQANWPAEIIAKAFKRDHGEYWANREFTKKQVAYIRSTYKPAPGMVKPYTGPIPQFSRSPTPEDSPDMAAPRRSKRKQAAATAHHGSSSTQAPVSERASSPVAGPSRKRQKIQPMTDTTTHHGEASVSERASSPVAGPSRTRQETQPMTDTTTHHGEASVSERASSPVAGPSRTRQETQPPGDTPTHHGSFIQGQSLTSGFLSGPLVSTDDVPRDGIPEEPFDVDANANDLFAGMNYHALESNPASRQLSLNPSNPGMMGPGTSPAQGSSIPHIRRLIPDFPLQDFPLQSIERHQSIATGAGTNVTNSAFPTPQQQQDSQLGMSDPQPLIPPGCTAAKAMAHDSYGVYYYDPHDTCLIRKGHRHDMDGGVHFTNEFGVMQSLLAMQRIEGHGFLLGAATTAQSILNLGRMHLANGSAYIDVRDIMRQAALIVHDNVPEVLDRERFQVPEVEDIRRLSETNSRLPSGYSYDPFHRRIVPYDIPGLSGTQGGGQGGGAAGSSRPSRQGSGPPGAGTS
ncbi:hypothetical protein INS49_002598 [Diaporthe citri]|uniref:uncharacterized protein n=1 Tax=Diaporthe citri TaxID=83186 RepID=UPI001C8005CD|nr:uncharacterized protein INS49_002598 [Diaporthe citri]KAG6368392.1 hypothetical protein INS49_002598 [Diaporthe citri]